ncbi:MAG: glycosyltransferase family 1 protein [Patescibacteria group bacterium]
MLIGIDGNEANVEKRVGISEYAFELLREFHESQKSHLRQGFGGQANFKFQIYLKDRPREDLPKVSENWRYRVFGQKKLWTQIGLPFDLYFHKPRPDVFFSPTHYAPRFSPIPTVISIMDLSYIHYPEMFKRSDLYQLENWTRYSVKKAKKIFTISQASKDDIIKVYNVSEEKVVVTYPGVKLRTQSPIQSGTKLKSIMQGSELLKEKYKIEGNYILFVGTLQPRKNIVRLIEAFAKVTSELRSLRQFKNFSNASVPAARYHSPRDTVAYGDSSEKIFHAKAPRSLELIIVGKKGWLYEEILEAPKKFKIEDKVKFLDFVPDEDLPLLYKNALCFVLPSLYEGFGLPVLEAMKYGCPVITSNVSSLPEAGGDAALYVDPKSIDDIASKIKLLIADKKLRQELIRKGYEQVKKFSWEKTARETLRVLGSIK